MELWLEQNITFLRYIGVLIHALDGILFVLSLWFTISCAQDYPKYLKNGFSAKDTAKAQKELRICLSATLFFMLGFLLWQSTWELYAGLMAIGGFIGLFLAYLIYLFWLAFFKKSK